MNLLKGRHILSRRKLEISPQDRKQDGKLGCALYMFGFPLLWQKPNPMPGFRCFPTCTVLIP